MRFVVYAHKRDDVIHYVGCGKEERAYDFYRRNDGWKDVFSKDNPPEVVILEIIETEDRKDVEARENHYQKIFKKLGHPLKSKEKAKYWLGRKRSVEDPETMQKLWKAGHSPEARAKRAEALRGRTLSDEHKRKISEGGKGRVLSQASRKKISESKKGKGNGRTGYKMSEETKKKLRQARKRDWEDPAYREKMKTKKKGWTTSKAMKVKCLENGKTYRCAKEAAADLGVCEKNIQRVCKGHRKTTAGYRFSYI